MDSLTTLSYEVHDISCGVLFERFARGGLASVGIGGSTGANYQGAYLMDIEHSTAEIIERTTAGDRYMSLSFLRMM